VAVPAPQEKVDQLGAARRLADVGEPSAIGHGVDGAGLAGVGAADKRDFSRSWWEQVFEVVNRGDEIYIVDGCHGIFAVAPAPDAAKGLRMH